MLDENNPCVTFSAQDRCDRCGAQAYSLAQREDLASELLFCLHHRKSNYDRLLSDGWTIIDDYEAISRLADNESVAV